MNSCNCSISNFKESVFPVVYLFIFFLGITGHLVSMYIFLKVWRNKRSLNTVNLFMINLLVSDLMLVCSLPFRAAYFMSGSQWGYGGVSCRLLFYVFYLNMYTSIFFLVCLNLMRYLALGHPYLFVRWQKCCNRWLVCFIIWLVMAVVCSPLLAVSTMDDVLHVKCLELPNNMSAIENLIHLNYATVPFYIVPLVIILFCSVFVAYRLLRPGPSKHNINTSRKKAFALVVISLGFFLICFLPYHVVRHVFLHAEKDMRLSDDCPSSCEYIQRVRKAAVVTLCLCTAHSCLDPILFFFVGDNFRTFFAKLLRKKKTKPDDRMKGQQRAELENMEK